MFERSSVIIKDGKKLSFDYVPKKIIRREEQMKQLELLFRPLVTDNRQCSALLVGSVGSGKTVTARRFCEDILEYCGSKSIPMDYVFVNCRIRNSEYSVVLQMLRHFDQGFPDRGFSIDEMIRSLRIHIEKTSRPIIIILDEVDVLLRNGSRNLVYQLSRIGDTTSVMSTVSLILISQESIVEMMDAATVSSFRRANAVRFTPYTRDEIREIIGARVEEALADGVIEDAEMELLADIAAENGDARFAIELIERSASLAEAESEGRVTADNIRTANAMIYSDVSENKLRDLNKVRKIILLAIARSIKDKSYVGMVVAEKTYAVVSEEYEQAPRKHTQFWTYVQDLEKQNLIRIVVKSEPDGGRSSYISIPNIPPRELAKKLEYILEEPESDTEEI